MHPSLDTNLNELFFEIIIYFFLYQRAFTSRHIFHTFRRSKTVLSSTAGENLTRLCDSRNKCVYRFNSEKKTSIKRYIWV